MATTRLSLSDQIRRAVRQCGMSQYRICQEIDLHKSVLSRFMAGHCGLSLETLDRLGSLLDLRVLASAKASRRKAGDR
ncbi:MAG TPA: helix-turn-helix transcriptional regulator [Tepidisphaeraceae bacterium]|nr:helix-turn-helix transcriptional regulator [Tepidisphaeraceae bacterium]